SSADSLLFTISSSGAHRLLHSFLHDALPICLIRSCSDPAPLLEPVEASFDDVAALVSGLLLVAEVDRPPRSALTMSDLIGTSSRDRKSTRLNSSHVPISYAVFCLKEEKRLDQ